MSDLRTALLDELAESPLPGARYAHHVVSLRIPQGAVLVTEETLAVAIGRAKENPLGDTVSRAIYHEFAAAILRQLREGT